MKAWLLHILKEKKKKSNKFPVPGPKGVFYSQIKINVETWYGWQNPNIAVKDLRCENHVTDYMWLMQH